MRSIWRTLTPAQRRDVLLVSLAVGITAVSYGATAVTSGFPAWLPPVLALVVLAGSAEFLYVGILATGGGLVAAVAAALLVNARHLPYGMATRDLVGTGWRRLVGAHVMNDESVVLGLGQDDREQGRAAFWAAGVGVLVCWPLGAVVGVLLGGVVADPNAIGLDAMFPAIVAGLVLPTLRSGKGRGPALAGAVIALVATPFVPAGLAPLLALGGLALLLPGPWRRPPGRHRARREGDAVATEATSGSASGPGADPASDPASNTSPPRTEAGRAGAPSSESTLVPCGGTRAS